MSYMPLLPGQDLPEIKCDTCGEASQRSAKHITIVAPYPTIEPLMITNLKHACCRACAIPIVFEIYEQVLTYDESATLVQENQIGI